MTAPVLRHPARAVRCWTVEQQPSGLYTAMIFAADGTIAVQTEEGPIRLVLDTVRSNQRHRGLPVCGPRPRLTRTSA